MYPDLYKGLEPKPEDLSRYDTPLVRFDGKAVTPKGQIKLQVVTKGKEVEVNFIVVNAFLPYTAILGRPWIHAIGTVPLALHQQIKFPAEDGVVIVWVDKKVARQCQVVVINHEIKQKDQVDQEQLQKLSITEGLTGVGSAKELRSCTLIFIGKTMEVYIDDIVVKTKKTGGDAHDLVEVFEMLRQHKLHLHAEKCAFGVGSGKFLGYMITTQDIEVNPNQITAIQQLCPPNNPKEVQRLIGMIAALTRFVSRSADRYKSFYKLLKKWKGFQWTEECYMTFKDLNSYQLVHLFYPDLSPKRIYICIWQNPIMSLVRC